MAWIGGRFFFKNIIISTLKWWVVLCFKTKRGGKKKKKKWPIQPPRHAYLIANRILLCYVHKCDSEHSISEYILSTTCFRKYFIICCILNNERILFATFVLDFECFFFLGYLWFLIRITLNMRIFSQMVLLEIFF